MCCYSHIVASWQSDQDALNATFLSTPSVKLGRTNGSSWNFSFVAVVNCTATCSRFLETDIDRLGTALQKGFETIRGESGIAISAI